MRSVRAGAGTIAAAALAVAVGGCVTTQEKNGWKLLQNARTLAAQTAVHVTRENPGVRVVRVELVRGHDGVAVVAELRNTTARPLTDLPILVGVTDAKHKRTYLNHKANIGYFDAHVSAIPPQGSVVWVLPLGAAQAKKVSGRPFAVVGSATEPPTTQVSRLPQIAVAQQGGGGASEKLRLAIANHSTLPQFGVQVYAVAAHGDRFVAAGRAAIGDLEGGASATVGITLLGNPARGGVQLYAPPTIFK